MSGVDAVSEILNEIFWMRREIREIKKTLISIESHLDDMWYRFSRICGDVLREFKKDDEKEMNGGER